MVVNVFVEAPPGVDKFVSPVYKFLREAHLVRFSKVSASVQICRSGVVYTFS